MRKIFVLDTNVLIHDPYCIYKFEDNEVVVPIFVIEEIDKLKRNPNTAIQARLVSRVIDEIRKKGSLYQGVELENDIFFRVEINTNKEELPAVLRRDIVDNMIISVTLGIQKKNPETRVVIVSKDINMRIKADALNLEVQDYKNDKVDYNELYTGFIDISVSEDLLEDYGKLGKISIDKLALSPENLTPNCFIRMNCEKEFSTGRYANGKVRKIILGDIEAWGLRTRNEEQRFAMELLMDESVKVVTLVGGAGTGKTLLAIAAALEQVVERKKYKKIFIARPIIPMGKDLGYLPGSEKEKLKPWMQPIFDNIEFLSNSRGDKTGEKVVQGLESMGLMKIEPLTYIRGRSIPAGFIVIDEAQNLTPLEIKTIVTRVGENTKIVFTGDPAQIDNPYLDANTNGLTYLAEKLKNESILGHITLVKGERSEVAEIAAKLL